MQGTDSVCISTFVHFSETKQRYVHDLCRPAMKIHHYQDHEEKNASGQEERGTTAHYYNNFAEACIVYYK